MVSNRSACTTQYRYMEESTGLVMVYFAGHKFAGAPESHETAWTNELNVISCYRRRTGATCFPSEAASCRTICQCLGPNVPRVLSLPLQGLETSWRGTGFEMQSIFACTYLFCMSSSKTQVLKHPPINCACPDISAAGIGVCWTCRSARKPEDVCSQLWIKTFRV